MLIVSPLINLAARAAGPRVAHRIYLKRLERWRTYEPEYYLLDHLVDPRRLAPDIGANEGIYSGRLAQLSPRTHCFEPIPWFAAALRRKLGPEVTVHECALSSQPGNGVLRIPYRNDVEMHGTSTLEAGNPLQGSTHVREVQCALARLDDVIAEPVGFAKIDVEGHELAVLEGAERILREDRPVLLIESEKRHNAQAPESIFRHLADRGYGGFFLAKDGLKTLSAFSADRDQRVGEVDVFDRAYINNFIFVPGG
jgi:FkbM family methyltransferase